MKDLAPIDEGADVVTKTYVDAQDALSDTLAGNQTITGSKVFTGGVKINGLQGTEGAYSSNTTLTTSSPIFAICDSSSAAFTLTLPATTSAGFVFLVKKMDATANAVTLSAGGGTIDGQASVSLSSQYATYWVESTTTSGAWRILASYPVSNSTITIAESQVTNLVSDLAAKATDSLVMHLAGSETASGAKTFSALLTASLGITSTGARNFFGSLQFQETIRTSGTAALSTTSNLLQMIDASAGAFSVALPATTTSGIVFLLKKTDSSANAITVTATSIDGAASILLSSQYDSLWVESTSTSGTWRVVNRYQATTTPTSAAGGDLTGTYPSPTLAAVGTAGTYGSATSVPVLTTDTKGRVTVVTPTTIQIAESQVTNLTSDLATLGVPTGSIKMYGGTAAPTGYLLCQGQAISRPIASGGTVDTYSALYAVISTTYGTGDGSTTFNVPDLQDRFPVGKSSTKALGAQGGTLDGAHTHTDAHTHTLSAHTHTFNDGGHTHAPGSFVSNVQVNPSGQVVVGNTASAGAFTPDFTQTGTGLGRTSGGTAVTAGAAVTGTSGTGTASGTTGTPSTANTSARSTATTGAPNNAVTNPGLPYYTTVNYIIKI